MSLERHFSWKGSVEVNSVIPLNFSKALSLKLFSANHSFRLKVVISRVFSRMNTSYHARIASRFKHFLVKESDEY